MAKANTEVYISQHLSSGWQKGDAMWGTEVCFIYTVLRTPFRRHESYVTYFFGRWLCPRSPEKASLERICAGRETDSPPVKARLHDSQLPAV